MRRLPRGGPRVSSLAQVATALQHVLTTVADQAGQETGFVQRVRKWTGALFVQTLVLGWLGNPAASLSELTQVAAKLGVSVSPQGLAQRFGEPAAKLLERVLRAAVEQVIAAEPVGGGVLAEPPQSAGDRLRHRRLPARPAELAGAAEGDAPRCASAPGSG